MKKINLEILKKDRKKRGVGDIFAFKPTGQDYYFGRIIKTDADCGFGGPTANLVYVYDVCSKEKSKIPPLNKDNLLIPPFFINNLPWTRGYFETLINETLKKNDVFENNVFWNPVDENYVDENNKVVKKKLPWKYGFFEIVNRKTKMKYYENFSPIGFSALSGYGSFSNKISKKLGIFYEE